MTSLLTILYYTTPRLVCYTTSSLPSRTSGYINSCLTISVFIAFSFETSE